ncbi:MAG TPA: hypothetical protein VGI45_01830 [Terracidiphilus sp.]|jgi:hypothetical protein
MTPQSSFMILATIIPSREAELRQLLASMNHEPGLLDPANALIPFGQFAKLHFARVLILDDQTLDDIVVYSLPKVSYPTYLAILGNSDGGTDEFLAEMAKRAGDGLKRIFAHCEGYAPDVDLLAWMKSRNVSPTANYVNWIGRTVQQVKEEDALRLAIETFLQKNTEPVGKMKPRQQWDTLKRFVADEGRQGHITLTPPEPTPLGWRMRNLLHLLAIPLLALILSPLILVALPFFLIQLRRCEKSDPEIAPRVDPDHANLLSTLEDHDVTNQFSAMGSLKPGWFRRLTMILVLCAIDYTARHIFNRGRLARVTSIQFARWVFLDGKRRVIFASNYDGSLESYMDDFINKVGFGLNVVFSNGIGYPTTNWLVMDGAKDEQRFKDYLRRHQMPTQAWYNAHPGLTALDKWRNSLIRQGLERTAMTDREIEDWLRLF